MFSIEPVKSSHAAALFPMIFRTEVTKTILWDGPVDFAAYEQALKEKESATQKGEEHMFTLFFEGKPAGSCSFRPRPDGLSADVGLWVGKPYQGKGLGSFAVSELLLYGFKFPKIAFIDAEIFHGNEASKRIFEKQGFRLTRESETTKRGQVIKEWVLTLTRKEYE